MYQCDTGQFNCHNKYYGRRLDANSVKETLQHFLQNGCKLRVDLIDPIIEQLQSLSKTLSTLVTFRFYSSSLLIMYDGADWRKAATNPLPPQQMIDDSDDDASLDGDSSNSTVNPSKVDNENGTACGRPLVRMIDFAHATHHGFRGDRIEHDGPDHGYLFGLENLIKMFRQLKEEQS